MSLPSVLCSLRYKGSVVILLLKIEFSVGFELNSRKQGSILPSTDCVPIHLHIFTDKIALLSSHNREKHWIPETLSATGQVIQLQSGRYKIQTKF